VLKMQKYCFPSIEETHLELPFDSQKKNKCLIQNCLPCSRHLRQNETGLCTGRLPEEPEEAWLQRVDAALYAAKAAGRNQVCGD